jgi:hypothetical protein
MSTPTLFDQPEGELRQPTVFIDAKTLLQLEEEQAQELRRCMNEPGYIAKYMWVKGDTIGFELPDWMRRVVEMEAIDTSKNIAPINACMSAQRVMNQIASAVEWDKQRGFLRNSEPACPTATQLRDQGISSVTRNEKSWLEAAHALIARYPTNEANAEELRVWVEERIGGPAHVNAYGAMIMSAVRKGLLKNTGIYTVGKRPSGHGRRVANYIINK